MPSDQPERTPRQKREDLRAGLSRFLRQSLERHDVAQQTAAAGCGANSSKGDRWVDARNAEVPSVADLVLLPRAVALDLLNWVGGHLKLTVAEDVSVDRAGDHLGHLAKLIEGGSRVTSAYSCALIDSQIDTVERRLLIELLRASVSDQTALLRELENEESEHLRLVARRAS